MSTLRVTNIQDLAGNSVFVLSGGNATIAGDLTVQGTTTSIETTNLTVKDKNIVLGLIDPAATDATADGGGITLKGTTDKTIAWVDETDAWASSERFSVPLGSAGAPSLTFTGDPNTGIYSPGADQLALATGGIGRLFVDATGNVGVGIGTTSPGQILEVVNNDNPAILLNNSSTDNSSSRTARFALNIGNTLAAGIRAQTTSGSDASDASLGFSAGGDATFSQMRILADGNVGIGTTNPSVNLHIFGTGSPALRIQDGDGTTQYVNINHNNGLTSFDAKDGTDDGEFRFRGAATLNEYLRIDSSGRLLVGTTSASTGALGSGIEELYSTASSETTHLLLHHNSNSGTQFANLEFLKTHGGNAVLSENTLGRLRWSGFDGSSSITAGLIECEVDGTPDANDMPGRLVFSTTADGESSPTERMRIDSAGQVLIAGSGTLSSPAIAIGGDVNSGLYSPGTDQVAISTNGTQRLLIDADGNINIDSDGLFYNASDDRLGIGTASPTTKLHIFGTGSPALRIQDKDGTTQYVNVSHNNGLTTFDAKDGTDDGEFRFRGASTTNEYLRIDRFGRLLVGASSALQIGSTNSAIQVKGTDSDNAGLSISRFSDSTAAGYLSIGKARGSIATPAIVNDDDTIGTIQFAAYDGVDLITRVALFAAEVDGTPGTDDMPGRLVFSTTAGGASSPTERMRISSSGQVNILGSGTSSSPALVVGGDTNSGLYSPGTDQVAISTNGTQRLLIDADGNINIDSGGVFYNASDDRLGIGTASPTTKLHISAPGQPTLRIQDDDGTNQFLDIFHNNGLTTFEGRDDTGDGSFRFIGAVTTNEFIHIASDGKVGLGISNPSEQLDIVNTSGVAIRMQGAETDRAKWRINVTDNGSNGLFQIDDFSDGSYSTNVTITETGRVGIGVTNPGAILDVRSDVAIFRLWDTDFTNSYAQIANLNGNTYFGSRNDTANGSLLFGGYGSGSFSEYARFNLNSIKFNIDGSQAATIDGSGRLLIGVSSNSGGALLQVNGDRIRVGTAKTPASASDTGTAGEICWDSDYIYVCTDTDTWKRAALSTW